MSGVDTQKMLEQEPEFEAYCKDLCWKIMEQSTGKEATRALTDIAASFWLQGKPNDELVAMMVMMFKIMPEEYK